MQIGSSGEAWRSGYFFLHFFFFYQYTLVPDFPSFSRDILSDISLLSIEYNFSFFNCSGYVRCSIPSILLMNLLCTISSSTISCFLVGFHIWRCKQSFIGVYCLVWNTLRTQLHRFLDSTVTFLMWNPKYAITAHVYSKIFDMIPDLYWIPPVIQSLDLWESFLSISKAFKFTGIKLHIVFWCPFVYVI